MDVAGRDDSVTLNTGPGGLLPMEEMCSGLSPGGHEGKGLLIQLYGTGSVFYGYISMQIISRAGN